MVVCFAAARRHCPGCHGGRGRCGVPGGPDSPAGLVWRSRDLRGVDRAWSFTVWGLR